MTQGSLDEPFSLEPILQYLRTDNCSAALILNRYRPMTDIALLSQPLFAKPFPEGNPSTFQSRERKLILVAV